MIIIWLGYFTTFFWAMKFVRHLNKFLVSYITCEYYFSIYGQFEAKSRFKKALKAAYSHLYSLVFGAIFIPVLNLVRRLQIGRNQYQRDDDLRKPKGFCGYLRHSWGRTFDDTVDYVDERYFAFMAVSGENFDASNKHSFILNIRYLEEYRGMIGEVRWYLFFLKILILMINYFYIEIVLQW